MKSREFERSIREKASSSMLEALDTALRRARPVIEAFLERESSIRGTAEEEENWIVIDSFSRLRKTAGGRFENLRKRWLAAGFPLKEGEKGLKSPLKPDEKGWIELSSWLLKTGYQTRLGARDGFFEIKPISKR